MTLGKIRDFARPALDIVVGITTIGGISNFHVFILISHIKNLWYWLLAVASFGKYLNFPEYFG